MLALCTTGAGANVLWLLLYQEMIAGNANPAEKKHIPNILYPIWVSGTLRQNNFGLSNKLMNPACKYLCIVKIHWQQPRV